jgi:hypothetical protein
MLVNDVNQPSLTGTASITVTDQATGLTSGSLDRVFAAADASESVGPANGVSSQPTNALDGIGVPATVAGGTSGQAVLTASPGDEVSVDWLDVGGPLGQAL